MVNCGGYFGVVCVLFGVYSGDLGWLSQRCDKNAQCSGRSSKSDAKVQKIFNICKFWRLKNIEKYIKVVERNGKDEKSKLGEVAPRVRPAGHERRREEDQKGMGQEGLGQEGEACIFLLEFLIKKIQAI